MKRKLTESKIKRTPTPANGKSLSLSDGGGLYLYIKADLKVWRYNYRFGPNKKQNTLTIGRYPGIKLKEARELHEQAHSLRERGIDPATHKKQLLDDREGRANTLENIGHQWLEHSQGGWSEGHTKRTRRCLEKDIFPWLGKTDINEVTASGIIKAMKRVEDRGANDIARRVKQYIQQIYKYAVTMELATRNPAADIEISIVLKPRVVRHMAAITDPVKIGQLMRDIDDYYGTFIVRCALMLSPLVMLRPGELRAAEWSEIDIDGAMWTIPVKRMKAPTHIKRANLSEHYVPLSRQAVNILKELKPLTGRFKYVFPSARGTTRCMSENTIRTALRAMGYENGTMTPHGFRGMASSILNESGWNPDAIERQLAHQETNKIRAAYNHAEYLQERREMLQVWADYLDELKAGAVVLPFQSKQA